MPEVTTLDHIAREKKRTVRPGHRYAVATTEDGKTATCIAVLQNPTDALVRAFDQVAQDGTRRARTLQSLTRQRMAAERTAGNLAVDGDEVALAEVEAKLSELEEKIADVDPTNPEGSAYYVKDWFRKFAVAFKLYQPGSGDELGPPMDLGQIEGEIQTRVVQEAVQDWTGLAFLSPGSRG